MSNFTNFTAEKSMKTPAFVFPTTLALCINLALVSNSSGQVKQEWVSRFLELGHQYADMTCMTIDKNDNIYAAGYTHVDSSGYMDFVLVKYNTKGEKQWSQLYDGPGHAFDGITAITQDKKGNIIVTGDSKRNGAHSDFATIWYNAEGNQQRISRYEPDSNGLNSPTSIIADKFNNVYVAGYEDYNSSYEVCAAYLLLKYDSKGNLIWSKKLQNGEYGYAKSVFLALDDHDNPYLAGVLNGPGKKKSLFVTKYNKSGDTLWLKKSTPANLIYADAFGFSKKGHIFLVGHFPVAWFTYVCLDKYDTSGVPLHQDFLYNNDKFIVIADMQLDNNGNMYLTGTEQKRGGNRDIIVLSYNSDLSLKWTTVYNSPANKDDEPNGLAIDKNGNAYITGRSRITSVQSDITILKYDSSGTPIWQTRYAGPASLNDRGKFILINSKGSVIVGAMTTQVPYTSDFTIIKYNQNKSRQ
jgi:hypothetical protein